MSVRHPEPTHGPFRWLSLAAVAFLAVVIAVAGAASYKDLTAARARKASLQEQAEKTRERIEILERQVKRLAEDPQTLEQVAREELGLVGPRDVVVILPEERPEVRSEVRPEERPEERDPPPTPPATSDLR